MEDKHSYWRRKGTGHGLPFVLHGKMGRAKATEAQWWSTRMEKSHLAFSGLYVEGNQDFGLGYTYRRVGLKKPDR